MNKKIVCSILLFIMIFSSLTTLTCAASTTYVYVTKTGSKYHKYGCDYLDNMPHKLTQSDAISRGYAPCKVCHTVTSTSSSTSNYGATEFLLDLLFLTVTYMLIPIILKYRKIELDNSDIVVIILLNAILQFSIIKYVGTNREIDNILFPILYSILNYCMLHWNKTSTT